MVQFNIDAIDRSISNGIDLSPNDAACSIKPCHLPKSFCLDRLENTMHLALN